MRIMIVAPHPDDETLGCGGSLFRHKKKGDEIYWLIVTGIDENFELDKDKTDARDNEIKIISEKYNFNKVFSLNYPTTKLDTIHMSDLIQNFSDINNQIEPEIIYIPFANDVHTDHQIISKAMQSTIKWFRYPFIKKVMMYETPSETEFNFIGPSFFQPNVFINISNYIDKKIEAMKIYESEMNDFPFPRSEKTIRSLAAFRGSQSGYEAAEAFQLIFERRS